MSYIQRGSRNMIGLAGGFTEKHQLRMEGRAHCKNYLHVSTTTEAVAVSRLKCPDDLGLVWDANLGGKNLPHSGAFSQREKVSWGRLWLNGCRGSQPKVPNLLRIFDWRSIFFLFAVQSAVHAIFLIFFFLTFKPFIHPRLLQRSVV